MEKTIVIVGAGFGGVTAALTLASYKKHLGNLRIVLIDKNPYQLYTPALYEIAAITKHDASHSALRHAITIGLKEILATRVVQFMQQEIISLKPREKIIQFANGQALAYEFLILALGSETNYFDIPGLKEHSFPLKTFDDGTRLRDAIEKIIAEKTGTVHVIIGGAGATGVELASEFINFICQLQKIYKKESACNVEVLLIEAGKTVLPGFSPHIAAKAEQRLRKIGVRVQTDTRITRVESDHIETNKAPMHYDLLVWAGGIIGPRILQSFELRLNNKNQIMVSEYLEAGNNIFAIGDNAAFPTQDGKALPANVPVAEDQARLTAENIVRILQLKRKKSYRPHRHYPYILAIGKQYAIADLVLFRVSGRIGWFLKQLVELRYLLFILPFKKALATWIYTVKVYSANDM